MNQQYTVLCVDDEGFILKGLERLLGLEGYRVLTALNGKRALEIMDRENVDLILADQRMPGMDGAELLSMVKKKYPNTIRIMVSGYSDFSRLASAINEGEIYRFIPKPWDAQELKNIVATALEQGRLARVINTFSEQLKKIARVGEDAELEITQEFSSVNVNVTFRDKKNLFSDEAIARFLNILLETLNVTLTDKDKLKIASGTIARQKGRIIFIVDFSKGATLRFEFS
jgi:YesN/AraC family two-component response regulator